MPRFQRVVLSVHNELPVGNQQIGFLVFSNEREFMRAYGVEGYAPRVDFSRYFLVAAHQGPCPTGGYSITIEGVERRKDQLAVKVRLEEPKSDDIVTLVGTNPQDMVLVPKSLVGNSEGRTEFSFIDQRGNCLARMSVSTH